MENGKWKIKAPDLQLSIRNSQFEDDGVYS
jgi:hypothetical protein